MIVWVQFAICLILIGVAGTRLALYADAIAEKTGMGGSWVGVVLLASVTSLPELATGISSVTVAGVPDIAVGDILGSCVFNLFILAILEMMIRSESIYRKASQGHILSSGFGIILIGIIGLGIILSAGEGKVAVGHVGVYSFVLVGFYIFSMRTVFRFEKQLAEKLTSQVPENYAHMTFRQTLLQYLGAALVVVIAGIWLPFIGAELAVQMQWNESFVGTLFVAFATSLPEMVVTIAAVRIQALDMAVGNVLGSNLFNTVIIAVDDFFYLPGPLLADVEQSHIVSALVAIVMTGVVVVSLFYRTRRMRHVVSWSGLTLIALYILNAYTQYQ